MKSYPQINSNYFEYERCQVAWKQAQGIKQRVMIKSSISGCVQSSARGTCVRLVLFHVSLMFSRREEGVSSQALQMILNWEELQIPDRTKNNYQEESEIMKKNPTDLLVLWQKRVNMSRGKKKVCVGKPNLKKTVVVEWVKLDKSLKVRTGKGHKLNCAEINGI